MPNGINDISPDLRDFLLNKNLILADTITNGGLSGLAVGLGQRAKIETLPNAVQPSESIDENGVFYRDLNLTNNPYKSINGNEEIDINGNFIVNIGNLPPGTSPVGYQHNIGSERENSDFNAASDTAREQMLKNKYFDETLLQKINLNTVFVAPDSDGVYDFRASVASRRVDFILNATNLGGVSQQLGTIGPDSALGQIGDTQLTTHFGYNAAFGAAQETLGHINLNPLSLLQGNNIFVPNFTITVPKGELGSVVDFAAKVLGFEAPVSILDRSASIFGSESKASNIARANQMVINTGKGQVLALIDNLNQNKFKPTINDDRKRISTTKGDTGTNGQLYAFESGTGDILDLLNTTPTQGIESVVDAAKRAAEDVAIIAAGGDIPDRRGFEEKHGKITSELDGGFNDDFDTLANVFELGGDNNSDSTFIWKDKRNNPPGEDGTFNGQIRGKTFDNKKTLLAKTQELFDSNKMRTLTTGHGVKAQSKSEIQTAVQFGFISKGSGVLSSGATNGSIKKADATAENVFCRTWTTFDKYNHVEDLQKSSGLLTNAGSTIRKNVLGSVLDTNGFVRIAPNIGDDLINPETNSTNVKKFMFSIENLAWDGQTELLPPCEIGPGDLMTGTKGRIMWFPPYGMSFTDNTSAEWDSTKFIGRGEPIYTYNNTERTGTLQWQIIIDHATYINDLRDDSKRDEFFASVAAGCADLNGIVNSKLSQVEKDQRDTANVQTKNTISTDPQEAPDDFKIYFPNDAVEIPKTYEDGDKPDPKGKTNPTETFITQEISKSLHSYDNRTNFALNGAVTGGTSSQQLQLPNGRRFEGWLGSDYISELASYLTFECPSCVVEIAGFSSTDGEDEASEANLRLAKARFFTARRLIKDALEKEGHPNIEGIFRKGESKSAQGCSTGDVDSECKKKARNSTISFSYDPERDIRYNTAETPKENPVGGDLAQSIKARFFNECTYFKKMEQDDRFIYNSIREKVKYFHPSFHSITPEGFNSRLTFLQQCTRQGPTVRDGVPTNLSFGKPPICILRVGDFYHSKIAIDNIALSFDPLVWDLNPEGVGVQPMICNVDMSFKFIGGSSLQGPINRLQNAVSFNYFANTEIYDERADFIQKGEKGEYILVNGVNPNNFGVKDEDSNKKDSLSSGVNNNSQPDIDQTARADNDSTDNQTDEEFNLSEAGVNFGIINWAIATAPIAAIYDLSFTIVKKKPLEKDNYRVLIKVVSNQTHQTEFSFYVDYFGNTPNGQNCKDKWCFEKTVKLSLATTDSDVIKYGYSLHAQFINTSFTLTNTDTQSF